jgi:hypothetical protein
MSATTMVEPSCPATPSGRRGAGQVPGGQGGDDGAGEDQVGLDDAFGPSGYGDRGRQASAPTARTWSVRRPSALRGSGEGSSRLRERLAQTTDLFFEHEDPTDAGQVQPLCE